eukprot:TRINITY_DN1176_c0_g1_i4.p2 TRINITY_DN1176_c0_g1~~TRINITY_DN1176_c0_g1_i4.p2  ORF type:complete len:179 (+),score=40.56 TRINITY_DN1176_c0_g1_i4:65-601(+)
MCIRDRYIHLQNQQTINQTHIQKEMGAACSGQSPGNILEIPEVKKIVTDMDQMKKDIDDMKKMIGLLNENKAKVEGVLNGIQDKLGMAKGLTGGFDRGSTGAPTQAGVSGALSKLFQARVHSRKNALLITSPSSQGVSCIFVNYLSQIANTILMLNWGACSLPWLSLCLFEVGQPTGA